MSFYVHQYLNELSGAPEARTLRSSVSLAASGMPAPEIEELSTYRIAYPLVPQVLFPSTRPDMVDE
jgi:hypothetical protein